MTNSQIVPLNYIALTDAARKLGLRRSFLVHLVVIGVIPHVRDEESRIMVDLEECKFSLFWYNIFFTAKEVGPTHPRKQFASQMVKLLRKELEESGSTFLHDFDISLFKEAPIYKKRWFVTLTQILAGVGLGSLIAMVVHLVGILLS